MQINAIQNYSIRLGPHHRQMLATVAEATDRRPANVIRYLIRREYEMLAGEQTHIDDDHQVNERTDES